MGLIFLSEYVGGKNKRIAHVYKNQNKSGFAVICYQQHERQEPREFASEHLAEEFAEDWVLSND